MDAIETNKFQNVEKFKKPTIYVFISIFATLIDIVLLYIGVEYLNLFYLVSATISYATSVLTKFTLNKYLVFQNRPGKWNNQLKRFVMVSVNGLIITNILLFIGVSFFKLSYIISKLITVAIVFIYTATLHNFVSFSKNNK